VNSSNPADVNIVPGSSQRFEDWLFPKIDNNTAKNHSGPQSLYGISPDSNISDKYQSDSFLKDLAGLNNMTTSSLGNQFLDDFLFNVVEGTTNNINK